MKKMLTCSICTLTLFAACKKNDNNTPSIDKSKLYGRWSEVLDVYSTNGSAPDSNYFDPNKPFVWDYQPDYFVIIGFPGQTPDTGKYTISGTTMNWLDSNGNSFFKQSIDVLNDTMLVLGQHSAQRDILSFLKRQ